MREVIHKPRIRQADFFGPIYVGGPSMSAFEGAESNETRGSAWIGSRLSPAAAEEESLAELRTRSRELYRNDSIGGAVETRLRLVVSTGFTPQSGITAGNGITQAQADSWNEQLENIYWQIEPTLGVTGKESLWQCVCLAERHIAFDGEAFVVLSDVGGADKPIPLTIEVIDPERVETPNEKVNDPRVRMGIEYDSRGRIVAYYVRRSHPHDSKDFSDKYDRLTADRVVHIFDKWFAGQSRGLPWMTRTLNRIKDSKDANEAAIIAFQVQSCFAAFVESDNPYGSATNMTSGTATIDGRPITEVAPGAIISVGRDKKVSFSQPAGQGQTFAPFMEFTDRKIASAMNFPYEMLAKNWVGLSFAAGRLVLAEAKLATKSEQKLLKESLLRVVWNRIVEEAVIVGAVDIPPQIYRRMSWRLQMHEWGSPPWPYALTPGEEIDAAITAIEANLDTKQRVIAEMGGWFREVFKQRAIENQLERDLKILPGSAEAEVTAEANRIEAENAAAEMEQEAAV